MKHLPRSCFDQLRSKTWLIKSYPQAALAAIDVYLEILITKKIAEDQDPQKKNAVAASSGEIDECGNRDLLFWITEFDRFKADIFDSVQDPDNLEKIALRTKAEEFLDLIRRKERHISKIAAQAFLPSGVTPANPEGTPAKTGKGCFEKKPRKRRTPEECVSAYFERKYNSLKSAAEKKAFLDKLMTFVEKKKALLKDEILIEYHL